MDPREEKLGTGTDGAKLSEVDLIAAIYSCAPPNFQVRLLSSAVIRHVPVKKFSGALPRKHNLINSAQAPDSFFPRTASPRRRTAVKCSKRPTGSEFLSFAELKEGALDDDVRDDRIRARVNLSPPECTTFLLRPQPDPVAIPVQIDPSPANRMTQFPTNVMSRVEHFREALPLGAEEDLNGIFSFLRHARVHEPELIPDFAERLGEVPQQEAREQKELVDPEFLQELEVEFDERPAGETDSDSGDECSEWTSLQLCVCHLFEYIA